MADSSACWQNWAQSTNGQSKHHFPFSKWLEVVLQDSVCVVNQVSKGPSVVRDWRPLPVEAFPRSPVPPGDRNRDTLDRPQPHCLLSEQSQWPAFFEKHRTLADVFSKLLSSSCVHAAGCRCSWEDQPGVTGWEKRPGCDLLWPEALLWQHLPGAAVCSFWLSVTLSLGPAGTSRTWSHIIALRRRTRTYEDDITTA